jgi:hypothetical protein
MSLQEVITALADHWDETASHLSPRDLRLLTESIRSIQAASDSRQAAQAAANLTTILAARLPVGHPVLEAISSGSRLVGEVTDWSRIDTLLRAIPASDTQLLDLAVMVPGSRPSSEPDVDARLLAAPALTAPQVREHGADPERDDLIRLSPEGGATQLPAFQFGPDGRPIPVVMAINRMLEAAADPWGVADWWLGRNAWLDGTPADLLGHVDDALLVMAARAEFPEA